MMKRGDNMRIVTLLSYSQALPANPAGHTFVADWAKFLRQRATFKSGQALDLG